MLAEAEQHQPRPALDRVSWGKYTFARESFAKISADSLEFLSANYEETGQFQEEVPLDVDWDSLLSYEANEQLLSFALRTEGKLVGYAVFILSPTLHAKSTVHAMSDVIYIAPKYRQGYAGVKFLRYCEEQVKAAGAKVVHMIMKAHPSAKIVERLGYRIYEVTYMKVL